MDLKYQYHKLSQNKIGTSVDRFFT